MSFPGPNQPPSNGGGNKPNGGNNPFTNPFSRNNDGKNGSSGANGNKSNGPRPFWQSPWLWALSTPGRCAFWMSVAAPGAGWPVSTAA